MNTELNWKTVTKGRRSRKPIPRYLNGVSKAGNSASPKRVGDFSGSDSDKFGEVVPGQSTSGKSENVPIKKRRHLVRSPSPCPWTISLRRHSASPPRSSPFSEESEQHQYHPSCSSHQRSAKFRYGKGYDVPFLCGQTAPEYNEAEDFSGIELLAAAASMHDDTSNAKQEDLVAEDSIMPKTSETTSSDLQSKVDLRNNESENSSSIMTVGGNTENFQNNSAADDETMPKVKRQHWDLNTPMDAWVVPDDDSIAGNTSNDVSANTHIETITANNVPSNLNTEENESTTVSPDRVCSEEEHVLEPTNSSCYNGAKESCDQATKEDANKNNSAQVLCSDAHMENPNQVTNLDAVPEDSSVTKLCCTPGLLISEGKSDALSAAVDIIRDDDCSSNVSECERTTTSDSIQTNIPDVTAVVLPACGISDSGIAAQCKAQQISELPGTDRKVQAGGTFVSSSIIGDCQGHLEPTGNFPNNHPREGIKTITMEDSCKSSSPGAQCDEPTTSVGRIGSGIDGDDSTRFEEGYDSSYEDGELRGSFLYSLEDNEMENECVDYESDGKNGDGSDAAADYPTLSEVVEGGSGGTHGTPRRNLLVKRFPEGNVSKTRPSKPSLRREFVKDDTDSNEIGGKGMVIEENDDDCLKRRQLTDRREAVDTRIPQTDEYASKTAREKLHSRVAAYDGNDVFYIQPCRSRRFAPSYTRPERDNTSPERYGRYRPATHDERLYTPWCSRRRYTSNYQGGEGRRHIRQQPAEDIDFHEPRQPPANYLSKGLHRPLTRRSPVERDDYFPPTHRRMPRARGVGNYGSRGHYSQRGDRREFAEDFEPLPDEAGTSARMPRYISRRERSFSPNPARNGGHAPLPRRRSRSRSRTRSPRPWHSHRERVMGPRAEARMERLRALPFSKPNFGSDYGGSYVSPPPRDFSPHRNNVRWIEDRPFGDSNNNNQLRRRRYSPVRMFRRDNTQRLDGVGSSGRLKSDEYTNFRPMIRPGRFKLDSNYDDRRGLHNNNDDGGNVRRSRHNGPEDFEMGSSLNNDDDVPKDAQAQAHVGDGEDKRAIKV